MTEHTPEANELVAVPQMKTRDLTMYNTLRKSKTMIEAQYSLTLPEQKIIAAILSVIDDHASELGYIEMETKDLCEKLHINLRELKEFTYNIVQRGLKFQTTDEDGSCKYVQTTWLSSASYLPSKGIVRFRFSEELKPYIIDFQKRKEPYAKFETRELATSTCYAIRIYELAKQYLKRGKTPKIKIETLRNTLGIDANQYAQFNHFRTRVLDSAVQAIQQNSDMPYEVSYELFKTGRSYSDVVLTIRKKAPGTFQTAPQNIKVAEIGDIPRAAAATLLLGSGIPEKLIKGYTEEQMRYLLGIIRNGVNPPVLASLLERYPFEHIRANNEVVLLRVKNGKCTSYGAMFCTAVRSDWAQDGLNKKAVATAEKKKRDAKRARDAAKYVEEKTRQEWEQRAAEENLDVMNDMEIILINRAIQSGKDLMDYRPTQGILWKYQESTAPRIKEALALIAAGKEIPQDFFTGN